MKKADVFPASAFFSAIKSLLLRLICMKGQAENLKRAEIAEWFGEFHRMIHAYLFALTQNCHLADDLTQETFAKAWANRASYEEKGNAKAFLFQIAVRCLKDHFRKKKETLCGEETWAAMERISQEPTPPESLELKEEIRRLRSTMARLSRVQQEVLTLRYFSQLKFSEIAEILEMPLNTILSHAHRGLAELKANFEESEPKESERLK